MTSKAKLHPCIFTLVWLGLLAVRVVTPYPDIQQEAPIQLREPIQCQTFLGWKQLYYGCLSLHWATAIDTLHPNLAVMGEQVMINITIAIWTFILDTWQLHNQHLHQNMEQLDHPNYQQAVTMLYELCNQLPPAAQTALYRQLVATLLEQPTPYLQTWYQWGQKYFKQQVKAAKKQASLCTPGIQTFFHPKTQHEPDLHPPPRKPWHTEIVWVFFVHHNLREITLKMLSFLRALLVCVLASYTKSLLRVVGITILAVRKRHPISYKKETCLNSHVLAMYLVFQAFHQTRRL